VHNLIELENVGRRNTGASRTDVERLGEFDELDTGRIRSSQENRHLQAYSRGLAPLHMIQALAFLQTVDFHSAAP
jgi:hypothetical protein